MGRDLVASAAINFQDIKKGGRLHQKPFWINYYGACEENTKYTDFMNKNPEFGSEWRGRVQFQIFSYDLKSDGKPLFEKCSINRLLVIQTAQEQENLFKLQEEEKKSKKKSKQKYLAPIPLELNAWNAPRTKYEFKM